MPLVTSLPICEEYIWILISFFTLIVHHWGLLLFEIMSGTTATSRTSIAEARSDVYNFSHGIENKPNDEAGVNELMGGPSRLNEPENEIGLQSTTPLSITSLNSKATDSTALEMIVTAFKSNPFKDPNLHQVSVKKYQIFNCHRTADLYTTFLALIGEEDLTWCNEARFALSFKANAPFSGRKNERSVCGGINKSNKMHGIVRYEYVGCAIEECRKDGKPHGLRVTCTQMGDIWIRLYRDGERLAQLVLNSDLSPQFSIDDGGLKILRRNIHLIHRCFNSSH